ncbi:DUF934 domain-containing protein [Methylomarinum sp. Ch1-1]|uniref:DUF934 domain-containing protein n=1 Tax=Methylomarinum roseum TaxID=3067653 RepID=A0AAU7NXQ1_9GAMM|nr:DUF934 domain-containing protein [Methylomarinum sp. Ch1-1]MDP4522143.1 DUF934 domain-containing protein [Methylomarinum sp. Ch1-1]
MQIIKDKQITDNTWTFVADDDALSNGDISVTLTRWKKDKERILKREGKIGIRLATSDEVADLAEDLDKINLIELEFPVFTDGRAFSQARLLRGRYHYQGEIRAIGGFMADQAFYLSRVGVNAFQLDNAEALNTALSTLNDFSVHYQASSN